MRSKLFTFDSIIIGLALLFCVLGCGEKRGPLPILGERDISDNGDTIYHRIPTFKFIDQDSNSIDNNYYKGKVYVTDFFFTSCPTICPKMAEQMLRIYDNYINDARVMLLSHSIDPVRDSVPRLKDYADKLEVSSDKWSFVTGDRSEIYDIAEDYFSIAMEDEEAPGGFNHSGRLILIDWNGHLRSFADGTDTESVNELMKDIDVLLKELESIKENTRN